MIKTKIKSIVFFTLALLISSASFGQKKLFSGIYTIGGNNANYSTIQKALSAILADDAEVIGRVTFNIRPGVYDENIVLKPYKGASAKNFVVFKSETGRAADVTIRDDGDNTLYNNQVVRFEGCQFYTLQDLTIENSRNIVASNNYASVVQFTYNRDNLKPADNNTLNRCIIKLDDDYTAFNGNAIGIVSSDINNTSLGANCANFNNITNNTIIGGTFAIKLLGRSTAQPARGNRVTGNKISKCYNGIDIENNNIPVLAFNEVNCRVNPNEAQFGIRVRNTSGNFSYYSNIVRDYGTFGMFFYNVNGGAAAYIYNNMILGSVKTSYSRGIHVEFSKSLQFYHNTIQYSGPFSTQNAGFVVENSDALPSTKISIKNNIFTSSGGAATMIIRASSTIDTSNYNDYFNATSSVLAIINGVNRTSVAAIRTAMNKDGESVNINPDFTSTTTLRIDRRALIRKAFVLKFVTVDFENHPRDPETPDIGADEVIRSASDMEVFGLDKNFVPREGLNSLPVVIKNDGLNNLNGDSIRISYRVNSGAYTSPQKFYLTQLNKPYFKQTFTLATQWNIPSPGNYILTIRVTPPVTNDTWQENDSIQIAICVGLNGRYTIGGPAGPKNYTNFQNALFAFECGVGGPTVFDVYPGTYAGFTLPSLRGVSSENTLTFRSVTGNAADVIITNTVPTQTTTTHPTIQVNGTDFVTFKNLTLSNTSTSAFASGFHITNDANNVTIDSCIITVPTSSSANDFKFPIVVSDRSKIDSGVTSNNLIVRNSTLRNGFASVALYGRSTGARSTGLRFINNKMDSAFFYGVVSTFSNPAEIRANLITLRGASNIASEGIRILFAKSDLLLEGNRVLNAAFRGINFTSVEGVTNMTVSNNMIGGGFRSTGNGAGIYLNEVNKISLINNSVRYDASSIAVPNLSSAFFLGAGVNVSLFNNVFFNPAGGYAFFVTNNTSLRASNYNNYYTDADPVNGLYAFYTSELPNLTALKTAMLGFEQNSLEVNPQFFSSTNLHTLNPDLEGKGFALPAVQKDFDKENRNPLETDLGADEFILNPLDMALVAIEPLVFSTDPNPISVKIMNLGNTSLNGIPVKLQYSSDGTNWLPVGGESFTAGSNASNNLIEPYSTALFTFSSQFNAVVNNSYNFAVRIMPSDRVAGDPETANDTIRAVICTGLKAGTYTVGGASPDFANINAAVSAIACGVTGPVTFKIRPGTYSERFTINAPQNTSATNKIIFESESGNASDVIIASNGVGGNTTRNIVRLNRSKFIEFRKLSFENLSTSIAGSAVFQLTSKASNIVIRDCILRMDTNSTSPNLYCISTSDSANVNNNGFAASNISIIKNTMYGGNVGIAIRGKDAFQREEGIVIDSNTIIQPAGLGILTSFTDVSSIHANRIVMRKGATQSVGISMTINRVDTRFTSNSVINAATTGVSFDDVQTLNGILFANNMIGGNFRLGVDGSGVNIKKTFPLKMYNNSVLYDGNNVFGAAVKIDANSKGIRLINNAIYNGGTGYCMTVETISSIDTSDNNNLATKGAFFARLNNFDYLSFDEYREATLRDERSVSVDPDYFTNTDLRVSNVFMDLAALPIPEIKLDYFGTERDAEFPDIGAHEFKVLGDVELASIDSPLMAPEVYPSLVPVQITIRNKGQSKVSGLNVKYYIDGVEIANEVIPVEDPYRPMLPSDVLTYTFEKKFEPTATGTYRLRVVLELPDDIDPTDNQDSVDFFSSISSIIDGEVNAFVSPATANSVKGKTPVKVLIKNTGTVPIKDFKMNWDATNDALPPTTEVNTVELLPGDVISYTFADSIDCDPVVVRILKVYISDLFNEVIVSNNFADLTILNFAPCGQQGVGVDLVSENMFFASPYPNPSNSQFKLDFSVLVEGSMNIELIDVLGRVLKVVSMDNLNPGQHQANINVDDVAPGTYMICANFNGESVSTRVVVTK